MRNIFKIIVLTLSLTLSQAQSIERQVVASAGNSITDGTITVEFTLGETAVTTIMNGITILTQGFHQESVLLGIKVNTKAFLQGALLGSTDNLMSDNLREMFIPTISPYSDGLTSDTSVFSNGGSSGSGLTEDNIVDWVYVELRDKADNTIVKFGTSALLQRDGNIVGVDGVSNLELPVKADNYYLVVKHRNHLGIMSSNVLSLSSTVTDIDFTDANNQITYGTNAQTTVGMPSGVVAMWAGNVNSDTIVQYSGTDPDSPSILSEVINDSGNFLNLPTYAINGYNVNDVNMDGNTQYSGTNPDTPFILQNVLNHSGNILNFSTFEIQEQLPENN